MHNEVYDTNTVAAAVTQFQQKKIINMQNMENAQTTLKRKKKESNNRVMNCASVSRDEQERVENGERKQEKSSETKWGFTKKINSKY
jgi:hypothetical protein